MKAFSFGKLLLSLVALYAALGSYAFDWNDTHIYNPLWPPHAKFHNAQTMLLGTCLGLLALAVLWQHRVEAGERLRLATLLASFYWLTQAGAALFPGTALVDPQFAHPGQLPAQLLVDVVMVLLALLGYAVERRRQQSETSRLASAGTR
jgi:hypothetical protein